jgi:hypothetical protein
MLKIILTQKEYVKNPNTKTTYLLNHESTEEITSEQYNNITNTDTLKYFRRIGGSESAIYGYTCNGYKVTRLTSTSPDKQTKIVRTFNFTYNA